MLPLHVGAGLELRVRSMSGRTVGSGALEGSFSLLHVSSLCREGEICKDSCALCDLLPPAVYEDEYKVSSALS